MSRLYMICYFLREKKNKKINHKTIGYFACPQMYSQEVPDINDASE